MKFTVDITREHYFAYNKYVVNKLKQEINKRKAIILLSNIFWLLIFLYLFSLYREFTNICQSNLKYVTVSFIVLCTLIIVYYVYSKFHYNYFIESSVKDNGDTLGKMEVELTETGLYTRKPQAQTFYLWTAFNRIDSGDCCYYLIIENTKAIILPKNQINKETLKEINKLLGVEDF